jgi:peptidoglycan/xylan/chitin deacetylase (PgdA/CDA1 family)
MLQAFLRRLLYTSGALAVYHRVRNADTLTIALFHRILDVRDPRWPESDPAYTLSLDLFRDALDFYERHYAVVSLDDVMACVRGELRLPRCALLLTFDDGWADNAEYACPELLARRLPATIFVASDAIGATQPFYQERIVAAWRSGRIDTRQLLDAVLAEGGAVRVDRHGTLSTLRELIRAVESLPSEARQRLLDDLEGNLTAGGRAMLTAEELLAMQRAGFSIGSHGKTHEPLTSAVDLGSELDGARRAISAATGVGDGPLTFSFPHGRLSPAVVNAARLAGHELLFSTRPVLNRTRPGLGTLLARVGFEAEHVADTAGRLCPERLAMYLFRRPREGNAGPVNP